MRVEKGRSAAVIPLQIIEIMIELYVRKQYSYNAFSNVATSSLISLIEESKTSNTD